MHFKRLEIICKTKGLPKPAKKFEIEGSNRGTGRGSNYVSPYRQNSQGSDTKKKVQPKYSPFRNNNYTPPNKRIGYSPQSNGSRGSYTNKFAQSPKDSNLRTYGNKNLSNNKANNSPMGTRSNLSNNSFSKKSNNSSNGGQNRLYSPSGRVRGSNTKTTTNANYMGYNKGGVNRVRREPAVSGAINANNSRSTSRNRGSSMGG